MGVPSSITLLSFFHTFFLSLFLLLYCVSAASDILTANQSIKYGEYLTSSNGIFKLRFFTPSSRDFPPRYVGIQVVDGSPGQAVWVANRENPIHDEKGIFTFGKNGNLVILDRTNKLAICWAALNDSELSINESHAQLLDSGNLVLREGTTPGYGRIIWESFNHPSHVLLPGMKIGINLQTRETKVLRSWTSEDDPTPGDFTFGIDPQHLDQFFVWRRSIPYWRSFYREGTTAKLVRPNINDFYETLINFSIIREKEEVFFTYSPLDKSNPDFTYSLLNPSGSLNFSQVIQRYSMTESVQLSAEGESCSDVIKHCGVFSSCNDNNTVLCKCLPGFEPLYPKEWNAKDWKSGCRRRSELECGTQDGFMPLRMKVSGVKREGYFFHTGECKELCVRDCNCNAFSYNQSAFSCDFWNGEIRELSEPWDEDEGKDFYLRLASSDLQNMTRMCPNCGTNIIPYPLSTSPNCGDPAYMKFHCDNATGQLRFRAPDDSSYAVINMDKDGRTFVIQLEPLCWPTSTWFVSKGIQLLNQSSPFHLTRNNTLMLFNCSTLPSSSSLTCTSSNMCERYIQEGGAPCFNVVKCCSYTVSDLGTSHSLNPSNTKCNGYMSIINANLSLPSASWLEGLEIGWDPPKEPICDLPVDCFEWPNTTCLPDEQLPSGKRCKCLTNFNWDTMTQTCIYANGKRINGEEVFKNRKRPLTLIITITVVTAGSLMLGALFYFLRRWVKGRGNQNQTLSVGPLFRLVEDGKSDVDLPFYDFATVSMATDDFSNLNKLGQGGFGAVYKGKLSTGQEIAVKRLSKSSGQGAVEFKNEVILIAKLQHRNLVRLMGYCIDGDEKILLYEYMPNKSLDFFLFDKDRCQSLDWTKRITIILGIARGLLYLHQDSRLRIIHRDLKTSNILLDEEMNPKISDFGLARIFGGNQIEENTNRIVGTYGYISPEYASHGIFSMKSDVFSFGVILVEIITGQKNTTFFHFQDSFTLLGHAWQLWMEEKALDLVDPSIRETCDTQEVLKCLQVGLLCVQEDAGDRPNMANVVAFFVSQTASLPTPKKPAFFTQSNLSTDFSHISSGRNCSRNEVTMSSVVGR